MDEDNNLEVPVQEEVKQDIPWKKIGIGALIIFVVYAILAVTAHFNERVNSFVRAISPTCERWSTIILDEDAKCACLGVEVGNPFITEGGALKCFGLIISPMKENNIQSYAEDWKTYTNEEYGFEFEYPEDWEIENWAEGVSLVSPERIKHLEEQENAQYVSGLSTLSVQWTRTTYLDGSEYIGSSEDDLVSWIREETGPLDKEPISKVEYKDTTFYKHTPINQAGGPSSTSFYVRNEGSIIGFHFNGWEIKDESKYFDLILSTLRFIDSEDEYPEGLFPEGEPIIETIVPNSGPIGTKVIIDGQELSGFEGDLFAVFEREDGKRIELWDEVNNYTEEPNKLEITIDEPCEEGETIYHPQSGLPSECPFVEFTPGTYKVYVEPWGYKSNEVKFTVTE